MREFQDIRSEAWRYTIVDNTNLRRIETSLGFRLSDEWISRQPKPNRFVRLYVRFDLSQYRALPKSIRYTHDAERELGDNWYPVLQLPYELQYQVACMLTEFKNLEFSLNRGNRHLSSFLFCSRHRVFYKVTQNGQSLLYGWVVDVVLL
ncbi:predicted protein [Pyrenophora tritici-repentis Pt-1C-BFP]|nr:uncharacterized protein PTRG_00407 [Pyrenophora tritici-repentis Pt-1C-BFP]EDU39845.1 predicted protein [Pyrenophora tritici-repentis Pt-1C-BFP]